MIIFNYKSIIFLIVAFCKTNSEGCKKNNFVIDLCNLTLPNFTYISDVINFNFQKTQCNNQKLPNSSNPKKPYIDRSPVKTERKFVNGTVIHEVVIQWSLNQDVTVNSLTGFDINFNGSNLFICLKHPLNFQDHVCNYRISFKFGCIDKYFNCKIQPGDKLTIGVASLNGNERSEEVLFNIKVPEEKLVITTSTCDEKCRKSKTKEFTNNNLFLIPLFVGLLILLLLLIFLIRRRHFNVITLKKSIKFNQINISEKDKTILPLTITPKHVLVHVADEDHDLFISVAMNLLHFLQDDVGIPIIAQQFDENADIGYTQWMENAVKQADKVVVIWSPLSKQRWINENSFDKFLPLIRHLKTQMILDPKSTQLAFVCFKCLGVEDSIPKELMDICPNFTLMQNLENLYFWLTGIEMYGPGQERCIDKVKYENFQSQPHGCNLKKAIDELEKDKDQVLAWYDDQISTDESSSSLSSESCDLSEDHKTFCYSVEGSDKDNRNIEYVQTKSYQNDNEFVESFCVSVESDSSNKSCSGSLMCQHCTSKLADCKYDQDILRVSTETLNCLHVAYDSEDNLDTHLSFFNFDDD